MRLTNHSRTYKSRGFSLIELMISLTIGLFLLLGLVYIFTESKPTYRLQENLARMQENGRLAFEYLGQDLRTAGYFGCATEGMLQSAAGVCTSPDATKPYLLCSLATCTGSYAIDPAKPVLGFDYSTASTWIPANSTGASPKDGTDLLTIIGSAPATTAITAGTANDLTVKTVAAFKVGEILLASDCQNTTMFKATAVAGSLISHAVAAGGNGCATWPTPFYKGGSLLKLSRNTYFIKDDTTNGVPGVPTLYKRRLDGTEVALVPNIEDFQVQYGVATTATGFPTSYVNATAATDWSMVKSIRIEILVRSQDDNLTTASGQHYYFNGTDASKADRRLRLGMGTTIGVRNRMMISQ